MLSSNTYPKKQPRYPVSKLGWHRVDLSGDKITKDRPSYSSALSGLAFDIWEHEIDAVTIFAFRGTDNLWDYVTANGAIPISVQYKSANKKFLIYRSNTERKIVATGHSLGGGLALSISARNKKVDAVVFDSSPRIFDGLGTVPPEANRILVAQSGEILEGVRRAWSTKIDEMIPEKNRYFINYKSDHYGDHSAELMALGLLNNSTKCNSELARFSSLIPEDQRSKVEVRK